MLEKPLEVPATVTYQAVRRCVCPDGIHIPNERGIQMRLPAMKLFVGTDETLERVTFDLNRRGICFQHIHDGKSHKWVVDLQDDRPTKPDSRAVGKLSMTKISTSA